MVKVDQGRQFIKFLGTAGARFVMIRQLRSSGGLWISYKGANILIDPGPGSIVRCADSYPKLDPETLDAIILTHRHLDHANDINVMIEAMTKGGFEKKGKVFLPRDSINKNPIVLEHVLGLPEKIIVLRAKRSYSVKKIVFSTSRRLKHPVETYGLIFRMGGRRISLVSDTQYFKNLENDFLNSDILILNVVFSDKRPNIQHLSFYEAKELIKNISPKCAILTHFGLGMLKARPQSLANRLQKELKIRVIAAQDGMAIPL